MVQSLECFANRNSFCLAKLCSTPNPPSLPTVESKRSEVRAKRRRRRKALLRRRQGKATDAADSSSEEEEDEEEEDIDDDEMASDEEYDGSEASDG